MDEVNSICMPLVLHFVPSFIENSFSGEVIILQYCHPFIIIYKLIGTSHVCEDLPEYLSLFLARFTLIANMIKTRYLKDSFTRRKIISYTLCKHICVRSSDIIGSLIEINLCEFVLYRSSAG